jgi:hypothetical protein
MKTIPVFTLGTLLLFSREGLVGATAKVDLYVDAAANLNGDGSKHAPYRRITDAVATARVIWQADIDSDVKIVIHVAPGVYEGSYTNTGREIEALPIRLDVPNLELRGSTSMLEGNDGWPTGVFEPGTNTLLIANPPLFGEQALLVVAPTNHVLTGHGVTVSKLSFNVGDFVYSVASGDGIVVDRVHDFTIRNNFVTGWAFIGISTTASSGKILGNYITEVGCGTCISAGNTSSPADVIVSGNRSIRNELGGVLLLGGGGAGEIFDRLSAVVSRNDLSNNNARRDFSFGLRVSVIRRDPPDSLNQTLGYVTATVSGNRITNNSFGVTIDAGFPYRTDPRRYTGTLDVAFENNQVVENRLTPALISFTRNEATLSPSRLNFWKFLERSTFNITYPDGELDGYWFDHPVSDPIDGRTLQNILKINGVEIPNGRYVPFP